MKCICVISIRTYIYYIIILIHSNTSDILWKHAIIEMGRVLSEEKLVKIIHSLCWNSNIWLSIKVIARQCKVQGWSSANARHHPLPYWPQNAPNIVMGIFAALESAGGAASKPIWRSGTAGCSGPWHDPRHDITVFMAKRGSYDVKCGRDTASLLAVMRSS